MQFIRKYYRITSSLHGRIRSSLYGGISGLEVVYREVLEDKRISLGIIRGLKKNYRIRSSLHVRIKRLEVVYMEGLEDQKQFLCKDQKIRSSLYESIKRLEIVYNVQERIRELEKYLRGSIRRLEKYLRGILEDQQFTRKYQNIRRVGYKQDKFKSLEDFCYSFKVIKDSTHHQEHLLIIHFNKQLFIFYNIIVEQQTFINK